VHCSSVPQNKTGVKYHFSILHMHVQSVEQLHVHELHQNMTE